MRSKITLLLAIFSISMFFSVAVNVEGQTVSLDARDSEIRGILIGLATQNGINLILGDSIQGKISITLSGVTAMEAIELILNANGFVAQKIGDTVIATRPGELTKFLPRESKVVALKYAKASDIMQSLKDLAPNAQIQVDSRTNSLIILGTQSDIQILDSAIKQLDVDIPKEAPPPPKPKTTRVFPLKNAKASSLRSLVSEFLTPAGKISIDERTNSLVITDEVSNMEGLKQLIEQFDVETPADIEKRKPLETRFFSLGYTEPNTIKNMIQEMLSPDGRVQVFTKREDSLPPLQASFGGSFGGTGGGSRSSQVGKKWSDGLIVTDTADTLKAVEELIKKIDVKTPQVKIEAKLVEMNVSDAEDLGVNWQATHSPSDSTVEGVFPIPKAEGIDLKLGTMSAENFENIMYRIQALEQAGKARILFNPSLITLNNEVAQMSVADKIPIERTYETEFRATRGFEFIDVGVLLTIIPHITNDGYILMDAMPAVDSIKEWTSGASPQPIISSRVAHTRVRVKDGETFVIGGLLKEEQTENKSGIPYLNKIPIIGRLFGSTSYTKKKTDLMIFITPKVYTEEK